MNRINRSRRNFITLGMVAAGFSLFSTAGLAKTNTPNKATATSRKLNIRSLNTNETLNITYFNGKTYDKAALKSIANLFRDRRSQEVHDIDPKVLDQLYRLHKQFGFDKQILLICGYRSPHTNAAMHSNKSGVAKKSLHMLGQAVDFRIEGVPLKTLREAALKMKAGGVGYYPRSNFIHIDSGSVRSWPRSAK